MERIRLHNGVEMPLLGLGVFQVTDGKVCRESVLTALRTGYRLIDTAACYGNEKALRQVMAAYGIVPMAWAPFAEGQNGIFTHPILAESGRPYGKTPAQVVLRWLRQNGIVAIPKSVHAERIQQNFAVEDFTLSPADMVQIGALDTEKPLILDVPSLNEVYRLHGIRFEQ